MDKSLRTIACIVGTRPEAIKMAPVIAALQAAPDLFRVLTVSTGQHREMLDPIFRAFDLRPDIALDVMRPNQSLEDVVSRCMAQLSPIFKQSDIDLVLVQGDTGTAFIAALTAFYNRIPVGHVEAGLRTFNPRDPFPEEMNRVLISRIAALHFAPTAANRDHLLREGVAPETVFVTGNTVIDALRLILTKEHRFADERLARLQQCPTRKILVTSHRRENWEQPLRRICLALREIARRHADVEIVYPVHLNPNVQNTVYDLLENQERIHLVPPQDYVDFVHLMQMADLILTDSGGVQEEAPSLGKPVLVLRETTERPEAIDAGTVRLVGTDTAQIVAVTTELLTDPAAYGQMARAVNPYGDGRAAERIVERLQRYFGGHEEQNHGSSGQKVAL